MDTIYTFNWQKLKGLLILSIWEGVDQKHLLHFPVSCETITNVLGNNLSLCWIFIYQGLAIPFWDLDPGETCTCALGDMNRNVCGGTLQNGKKERKEERSAVFTNGMLYSSENEWTTATLKWDKS